MDATGRAARRFPLIPRPRPVCRPLPERVAELAADAREAARTGDRTEASAVHNLAALLASDCGMPDLARLWCHRHADLYLHARPLDAQAVRQALEPLINLARLRIRAGDGPGAHTLVDAIHTAVATRTDTTVDGIHIPASSMATTRDEHREIRSWLWAVLLATTARALAASGRWEHAHAHLAAHRGIGRRMLDGRQIAVLTHATTGNPTTALELCATTTPGEPWEQAVTACLATLCEPDHPDASRLPHLYRTAVDPRLPGLSVFRCRLGLAIVDVLSPHHACAAHTVGHDLIRHITAEPDGYTARDLLTHPFCSALLTTARTRRLATTVRACALGAGTLPPAVRTELDTALTIAATVIAHTPSGGGARPPPPKPDAERTRSALP
ncbi:hypothetical protein ACWGR4_29000 [Embleya sp. NPDC055664]